MYGRFWVDYGGAVEVGLPPQAYGRENPMSDKMSALLYNPYFYVDSVAAWLFEGFLLTEMLLVLGFWGQGDLQPTNYSADRSSFL